jgi:hypothetical protein
MKGTALVSEAKKLFTYRIDIILLFTDPVNTKIVFMACEKQKTPLRKLANIELSLENPC